MCTTKEFILENYKIKNIIKKKKRILKDQSQWLWHFALGLLNTSMALTKSAKIKEKQKRLAVSWGLEGMTHRGQIRCIDLPFLFS